MGTIKLELDIPDFKDELSINITIKRDGEVLVNNTSIPPTSKVINTLGEKKITKKNDNKPKNSGNSYGGNFMDVVDF